MLKRTKYFIGGLLIALTVGAIAQTSGLPSRPRFLSVGVGTSAPATNGDVNVAGSVTASNFIGNVGGVSPTDFARLSQSNTFAGSVTASNFIGNVGGVSPTDFARISQHNTFTSTGSGLLWPIMLSSTIPGLMFDETDAAVDNRKWRFFASNEQLLFETIEDNSPNSQAWLLVDRTGSTVDSIKLQATSVQVNGSEVCRADGLGCPATSGTFTLTLSTGCTTTPSVTARYAKMGNIVVLNWPSFTSCTSNSMFAILTGLPAELAPTVEQLGPNCLSSNNGGAVTVSACSVLGTQIAVSNGPSIGNAFTTSGTKTVYASTFSYLIN